MQAPPHVHLAVAGLKASRISANCISSSYLGGNSFRALVAVESGPCAHVLPPHQSKHIPGMQSATSSNLSTVVVELHKDPMWGCT